MILIENARVFDGERVWPRASVLVAHGLITAFGDRLRPPRTPDEVVDGRGHTLLPGLIDAHTHAYGTTENLALALAYGVTTELDMFLHPPQLTQALCATARDRRDMAELLSSGTVVCAPDGYPATTMPGMPTLAGPDGADAFVAARATEGAHYIKIIVDDGVCGGDEDADGGAPLPFLDEATTRAVTAAAHARGLLTVVHVGASWAVSQALAAGADTVTHLPLTEPLPEATVRTAASHGTAFVPTMAILELTDPDRADAARALARDPELAAHLPADVADGIEHGTAGLPFAAAGPGSGPRFAHVLNSARRLHEAGVPLLAGTDANNAPWRPCPVAHGVSLHRELELLVAAGLSPAEALRAATAAPARHFGLSDRGRIAVGARADLLLVAGDPTRDITDTRAVRGIWRQGVRFDRDQHGWGSGTVAPAAEAEAVTVSER